MLSIKRLLSDDTINNTFSGPHHFYLYYGSSCSIQLPIIELKNNKRIKKNNIINDLNHCIFNKLLGLEDIHSNIISYLPVLDMIKMGMINKYYQYFLNIMTCNKLDLAMIPSEIFSISLTNIIRSFQKVKIIDLSNQLHLNDSDLLAILIRFSPDLVSLNVTSCQNITDQSLKTILDGCILFPNLENITFNHCKRITGYDLKLINKRMNTCIFSLPSLKTMDFYDSGIKFSFLQDLIYYFYENGNTNISINAIHTPAHYSLFKINHFDKFMMNMANLSSRKYNKNKTNYSMATIYQEFNKNIIHLNKTNILTISNMNNIKMISRCKLIDNFLKFGSMRLLMDVPLDEEDLSSALTIASEEGHVETVKLFIEKYKADIYATDKFGASALFVAAGFGRYETVKLLISKNANIEQATLCLATPTYIASEMGHSSIVELLLAAGACPDTTVIGGANALHIAIINGCESVVKTLLYGGLRPRSHSMIIQRRYSNKFLNDKIQPIVMKRKKSKLLIEGLLMACERGFYNIVKLMLECGIQVNERLKDGITPLYIACQMGHTTIVRLLLENGANTNLKRDNHVTCLYIAAQEGHLAIVQLLIEYNANVDEKMVDLATALHIATRMGHLLVVRYLLEKGADVFAATKCGLLPLHVAAMEGHLPVVEYLAQHCITINKDKYLVACNKIQFNE